MLLCSCSTVMNWALDDSSVDKSLRPPLPAETYFNKEAGRGGHLFIKLHLENGQELLFLVDTGAPVTMLDKSLEPLLGKVLATETGHIWYAKTNLNVYGMPKLYLENMQLLTGNRVFTDDFKRMDLGQPVMGILGMDCLRYYCIQLDFAAQKMRFFNPDANPGDWGKTFSIIMTGNFFINPTVLTYANFSRSNNAWFSIDTGCPNDAELSMELFHQVLQEQTPYSTNQIKLPSGETEQVALFSKIEFNHEFYNDFILAGRASGENLLGLRFMARNRLVTLNFPKRKMYLQRWPDFFVVADDLSIEALQFMSNLRGEGRIPGLLQNDPGHISDWNSSENSSEVYPVSRTFHITKNDDASKYNYIVVKTSKDSTWKLQRAWLTGADDRVIKEYPIPEN